MTLCEILKKRFDKEIDECTNHEIYLGLINLVKTKSEEKVQTGEKKKLYYICAEFLIGKMMSNALINLGMYKSIDEQLKNHGKCLGEILENEPEPSLGNGGLGRLAACFLDSIATLGLPGDGVGLNYHFGLFKQVFKDNIQTEHKNPWIEEEGVLVKTDCCYDIEMGDKVLRSRMYDINIPGYDNRTNKLHLFDLESVDESVVGDGIEFDKTDIEKNLTLFLYPDDSDEAGRELRIYQQYFMVANAARLIIDECRERGSRLHDLEKYAVIQINDTHPTMIIPELIRLLVKEGIELDEAIDIVSRCCAYTNHTILSEALEKWQLRSLEKTVPQLVPIIKELDRRVRKRFSDESVQIIDSDGRVHMAHIDIHYGFSVNGVASLHTEILKHSELKSFYNIYPKKFNNKTNGITFRRWLLQCNPELSEYIVSLIGSGFIKNALELEKLTAYADNNEVLDKLLEIKGKNKRSLDAYLTKTQGIDLNDNSVFDIQIKRLHEYKRQQMNALYLIHQYLEIKNGKSLPVPVTAIFGAKAAPAYVIAQDIIHLILCLRELINSDEEVSRYLKVEMVENYNVTMAEKLIPACDISEQISLASKEASGTGNMKMMLNGAVTLGTEDGANVEIHSLVGDENIYIFGDDGTEVIKRYMNGSYNAEEYYEKDEIIRRAVNFITGRELMKIGSSEHLKRLQKELINKDYFMTFPDFRGYIVRKEEMLEDYCNRRAWAKKMLINIAKAGHFSSDRTIEEYNWDIWRL